MRGEEEARRHLGEEAVPPRAPEAAAAPSAGATPATPARTTAATTPATLLRPKRIELPKPAKPKAAPGADRRRGRLPSPMRWTTIGSARSPRRVASARRRSVSSMGSTRRARRSSARS
jgi:hypothetical protein